jgi:hypothetical protein
MASDFIFRAFSEDFYIYVIDTNRHAGSFEREMCAFITGRFGECEVGEEIANAAIGELTLEEFRWFEENVYFIPDDHGCVRPVSVFPSLRWYNVKGEYFRYEDSPPGNDVRARPAYLSVAIFLRTMPPPHILRLLEKRTREYVSRGAHITIEGFRLVKMRTELEDCMPK